MTIFKGSSDTQLSGTVHQPRPTAGSHHQPSKEDAWLGVFRGLEAGAGS